MGAFRFIRTAEEFRSPGEDEVSSVAGLNAFPAEVSASAADETRRRYPPGGAKHESIEVTFPVFAPDDAFNENEDVPLPQGAPADASQKKSRMRFGLRSGFLLLVVLLQAVPAFLWLRQRFTASTSAGAAVSAAAPRLPSPAAVATSGDTAPAKIPTPSPAVAAPPAPGVTARGQPAARPPVKAAVPADAIPAALTTGRLSVTAPVPLQIYLNGKAVGITETETTVLPSGTHDLEFVNDAVGYRTTQRLDVIAGRTTRLRLDPPTGLLNVNASPWAEVWIDNERIGETPLGNIPVPIGSREVLFRHPQLGERRATVLITLKEPARLSVDFKQK